MNNELFYTTFSGGVHETSMIFQGDYESICSYVYEEAKDEFYEYAGSHGILSLDEFSEENNFPAEYVEDYYDNYVENTIFYNVERYNPANQDHVDCFVSQSYSPYKIA
jgi:hypothetical protein